MARESTSLRLSSLDKARIAKLRDRLDARSSEVVTEAICHFLATIEKDEPVYRTVPSEQRGRRATNAAG